MSFFFVITLGISCFFGAAQIISGESDIDIFVKKMCQISCKGFPYLCDRRYKHETLKNIVIPDDIVWNEQDGYSYKYVAVPDVFGTIWQTMHIILISCKNRLTNIPWNAWFSTMKQDTCITLVLKMSEKTKYQGQEIVNELLASISENERKRIVGLDCSDCNLTYIPEIILQFSSLRYFRSENNNIEEIPETFFLSLQNLKWLLLSENRIKTMPFLQHDRLEVVAIENNQLAQIYCGALPRLRCLHVKHNTELENDVIIVCLQHAPEIKKMTISDSGKYEFLTQIDVTKYQIGFAKDCIEITV